MQVSGDGLGQRVLFRVVADVMSTRAVNARGASQCLGVKCKRRMAARVL